MLTYRSSVVKYIERGRNGTKMNKKGSRQKRRKGERGPKTEKVFSFTKTIRN